MKTIGIVTDGNTSLGLFLENNINLIFSGFFKFNKYYLNDLTEKNTIADDLILTMTDQRTLEATKYICDSKKIVVVNRTIMDTEAYKLFLIPEGTDVLVVNDNKDTTLEMVTLLLKIGINHLNLISYDPSCEYRDIKIAITPGEINLVPKHINKTIDLGHRCIDIDTFLTIISRFNIEDKIVSKKLIEYSEKVVNLDTGIKSRYKELYTKNDDLQMIINLSNDGIALTNNDGNISIYNSSFERIFETRRDLRGYPLSKIFEDKLKYILNGKEFNDEIVLFGNKYLNINKCFIQHFGEINGEYFNIQEITYIKKLEQNLSSKLRLKGHIAKKTFNNIKTLSEEFNKCISLARKIASSNLSVLITGESGTGKEIFAQSIHNDSNRKIQPFVAVNCAAMPENLLESELFGYVEGAFTGALKKGKVGLFEQANNGTLFLDEIGDMPINLQTRLLRVLQEKQVMRLGDDKIIDIDVRIIGATNKDLLKMIRENEFRSDLYFRLNVIPINIPPLRERKEDLNSLLKHFMGHEIKIQKEALNILVGYSWPGNIRELENVSSYISLMSTDNIIKIDDLPHYLIFDKSLTKSSSKISKKNPKDNLEMKILELIYEFNNVGKSIGRSQILNKLLENRILSTAGEVRKVLHELKTKNLVTSTVGRGGTKITSMGIETIEANRNNG